MAINHTENVDVDVEQLVEDDYLPSMPITRALEGYEVKVGKTWYSVDGRDGEYTVANASDFWQVRAAVNCTCTQSEYVKDCHHVKAVIKAACEDDIRARHAVNADDVEWSRDEVAQFLGVHQEQAVVLTDFDVRGEDGYSCVADYMLSPRSVAGSGKVKPSRLVVYEFADEGWRVRYESGTFGRSWRIGVPGDVDAPVAKFMSDVRMDLENNSKAFNSGACSVSPRGVSSNTDNYFDGWRYNYIYARVRRHVLCELRARGCDV